MTLTGPKSGKKFEGSLQTINLCKLHDLCTFNIRILFTQQVNTDHFFCPPEPR
jgi:hypothetical protein